jgi:hypothetical protein
VISASPQADAAVRRLNRIVRFRRAKRPPRERLRSSRFTGSDLSFVPATSLSYDSYRMPSTTALDVNWTGRLRSVAALLEAGGHHAIIDPGPGLNHHRIVSRFASSNFLESFK